MRKDYIQKQKQLGDILSIILENPSAEVLEENLWKLRNLIEVVPDSLEFRIKIINIEEIIQKVKADEKKNIGQVKKYDIYLNIREYLENIFWTRKYMTNLFQVRTIISN